MKINKLILVALLSTTLGTFEAYMPTNNNKSDFSYVRKPGPQYSSVNYYAQARADKEERCKLIESLYSAYSMKFSKNANCEILKSTVPKFFKESSRVVNCESLKPMLSTFLKTNSKFCSLKDSNNNVDSLVGNKRLANYFAKSGALTLTPNAQRFAFEASEEKGFFGTCLTPILKMLDDPWVRTILIIGAVGYAGYKYKKKNEEPKDEQEEQEA